MNNKIGFDSIQELSKAALDSMHNALVPPNNDYRFGAAVLTKNGNIYSSGQYFSDTYSLTVHAEQCALIHAAAHGEYEIIAMAIISNKSGEDKINPCHMCKQLIYENCLRSSYNIELLLLNSRGELLETVPILDMINYPWPQRI